MRRRRNRYGVLLVAIGLLAAACSSGSTDTTAASSTTTTTGGAVTTTTEGGTTTTAGQTTTTGDAGGPVLLTIAAEDSEGFTRDRLEAKAGQEVTVEFQNKDAGGEPHNWHVAVNPGVEEYATLIAQGPDTQSVTFTIGTPGDYNFWCDTHTEAMRGILTVTP